MTTGKLGMNPDEVDQLARSLDETASQIKNLVQQVTQKLQGTTWEGQDRQNFESTWQSESSRQLAQIEQLLKDNATKARQNAQAQRTTSSQL